MPEQTAAALEQAVTRVYQLLDAMDFSGVAATLTEDAQVADEVSRAWVRGRARLGAYFEQLEGTITDLRSRLSDMHATAWGETGLVTFVLDQSYISDGQEQRLSAPASMVLRYHDDGWKVAMVHAVPVGDD